MRRLLAIAALLLALPAAAQGFELAPEFSVSSPGFYEPGVTGTVLSLLAPGSVAVSPLYCTASRQLGLIGQAGTSWACLNGDGTQDSSAGMTLSAVGSPTTQTLAWSPNGNNSTPVARQVVSASSYYASATLSAPTGDWSACRFGIVSAPLSTSYELTMYGASNVWALGPATSTGKAGVIVGAAQFASASAQLVGGVQHLFCASYHHIGTGTVNEVHGYVDGVDVVDTTAAPEVSGTGRLIVGPTDSAPAFVAGAFYLNGYALTSTDVSRLAAALIPTPQTASGVALSNSRNSASWVTTSDGTLVALPPGRTGVVGVRGDTTSSIGGVVSAPSRTTLNLYSEQLDQIGTGKWVTAGTIAVTQNAVAAPDGSLTTDTVTGSSTGTLNFIYQPFTATGGGYTISGWGKGGTSTAGVLRIWDNTASAELCHSSSASGASLVRVSCSVASTTSGHTIWAIVYPAGMTTGNTGSSTWFGVQFEQSSTPSPYCRSEGTSATCSGDVITVPTPSWLSTKEGCSKVCLVPSWTGNGPGGTQYLLAGGSANRLFGYVVGGLNAVRATDGTHIAQVAAGFTAGTRSCFVTRWSASAGSLEVDNITTSTAGTPVTGFSGFPSFDSTIAIGNVSGAGQPLGSIIDSVTLGSSAGGCQ